MLIADADTFHTTGFLSVSTAGCGLCVVHYILHTYRYEKVEFFFNFTPRMFTYPGKVEKKINFLTVELKIFSTGVEYTVCDQICGFPHTKKKYATYLPGS